ncbi:MAG TPA: hypothetical protein VKB77_12515 [Terriglobales bacterium]|nr:hypothetical protein [Terriglobales bacterium]
MIRNAHFPMLCGLCCLLVLSTWGQDSSDSGPALGDVARHQRERRQNAKGTRKVISDDDIPASRMHTVRDQVAEFVIIPAIRISGQAPLDNAPVSTAAGQKPPRASVGFGPHLTSPDSCYQGSLDCAEDALLAAYRTGTWAGSSSRVVFDSDGSVEDFPARVVHFEVVDDVRGKMLGTAALIQTPVAIVQAVCLYQAPNQTDVEPECDAFIASLQVDVPERYIYVEHH